MKPLEEDEIGVILRAADEIIAEGGRTLLAKILKGSREKKVLRLELDQCPVYGFFQSEKLDDVLMKVDWMLNHDFLDIEYSGRLPMIIFTERGWEIERDQFVDEFLREWDEWLASGKERPEMYYLKDRNRGMIWLFLDKIEETGNKQYIPYLQEWEKIDYKKVRARIRDVIQALEEGVMPDENIAAERNNRINEALKGHEPHDIYLKCHECGERFLFTVGEQQFYRHKGFVHPKRCPECREERELDLI